MFYNSDELKMNYWLNNKTAYEPPRVPEEAKLFIELEFARKLDLTSRNFEKSKIHLMDFFDNFDVFDIISILDKI